MHVSHLKNTEKHRQWHMIALIVDHFKGVHVPIIHLPDNQIINIIKNKNIGKKFEFNLHRFCILKISIVYERHL